MINNTCGSSSTLDRIKFHANRQHRPNGTFAKAPTTNSTRERDRVWAAAREPRSSIKSGGPARVALDRFLDPSDPGVWLTSDVQNPGGRLER